MGSKGDRWGVFSSTSPSFSKAPLLNLRCFLGETLERLGLVIIFALKALKSLKDNKNNTFQMRGGKKTQKNYTKKIFMTQITMMVWSLT